MRILVQQKDTGLYLSEQNGWVRGSSDEAMDFTNSNAAIDFCLGRNLSGVQLVLKFEGQSYDIVLPLIPLPEPAAHAGARVGVG